MALLPPGWPILVVLDETLGRRKGARIAAKGIYRDTVRSSKSPCPGASSPERCHS